jgi:hypothetical protein
MENAMKEENSMNDRYKKSIQNCYWKQLKDENK